LFKDWAKAVLREEGLSDCTMKSSEAYCWIDRKVIQFEGSSADYVLFLHEVAHALYPYSETLGKGEPYHGGYWSAP
jgi:hypothetical protein